MSLTTVYHSVAPFNSVTGCPILTNSATPVSCASGSDTGVLAISSGSDLTSGAYSYLPQYPLLMKLFFTSVKMDGTVAYPYPEYIVRVSGSTTFTCHRTDEKDFGLSLKIKNWDARCLDTTVSITPIPPLTSVTMSCLAGIATDTQDTPSVF